MFDFGLEIGIKIRTSSAKTASCHEQLHQNNRCAVSTWLRRYLGTQSSHRDVWGSDFVFGRLKNTE